MANSQRFSFSSPVNTCLVYTSGAYLPYQGDAMTETTTTTTTRARCECCGAELAPRNGRGRPRQYCPAPAKCTELAKRIERARVLMAEILEDAPSATRGRAFSRMAGLVARLDDDLSDSREDFRLRARVTHATEAA